MDYNQKLQEQQEAIRLENTIDSFFSDFQVGRLLNGTGIRKLRGAPPLKIFGAIFRLPFEVCNFFRGIAENQALEFGKDAEYTLLRNSRHNWRKLMLGLAVKIATVFSLLTDEGREKVLIFDSSTYDRSRSKKVELLLPGFLITPWANPSGASACALLGGRTASVLFPWILAWARLPTSRRLLQAMRIS